jgi:hypothetical protein
MASMVNGLVINSENKPDPVCEPCLAGKMNANPFPSSQNHTTIPLHRIHSDLHEMKTLTTSGSRYCVTYIDEATSYRAVVLLKRKSDAFEAFRTYKAYAENVLGSKIKELQMDQGGEFVSNAFRKFCADSGILMRYSVRNRPQQNGIAERANRTVDEHTTAMLYEANLPASFKGEAVAAYIHIWNRLPTSANCDNSKTPHELWFKSKPDVSHFRVWGCTAYVHVQKDKRTGIGAHMEKSIFMGYPVGYKGWKFWNPTTQRVVISERAEFDERSFPSNKRTQTEHSTMVPAPSVDSEEFTVWPTASQPPE